MKNVRKRRLENKDLSSDLEDVPQTQQLKQSKI